jgi:hypothetical protein
MFTTDNRTENFLTQIGVKFKYKNGIRLPDDLADCWNTENIGRPVPVRDDAVLEYNALMDAGSAAPAPIFLPTSEGLKVLDGVQRLSAADLRDETRVSGYVVETDSADIIATIRVLANARLQGRAEPAEWTRRRAVEVLVVDRGMTAAEVASMGGWQKADILKLAKSIELQGRINQAGGPRLPDTMLCLLADKLPPSGLLEKATQPTTGFLQTLQLSKLSAKDAEPYIAAFFAPLHKGANPHKTYDGRLDSMHEDPEIQARTTGRQRAEVPKDILLLKALKTADTVADQVLSQGQRLKNADEYFRLLDRITKKLAKIAPNRRKTSARVPADMWSK